MNCNDAIPLIHEFLDEDLSGARLIELNDHLALCEACRLRFVQLEKTEALAAAAPAIRTPDHLTDKIMHALPKPKRKSIWLKRIQRHPALTVAAAFFLVMFASMMSLWNYDNALVVKGAHLDPVVIHGDTVIVPADRTVNGDLIVENGKLQVDGKVKGNLIVIDGTVNLASTAYISGKVTQIDQAIDWFWYKIGELIAGFQP